MMCLQEDSDMAWFDLDISPILERCSSRGDVNHVRHRIRCVPVCQHLYMHPLALPRPARPALCSAFL